jgi:hypothetical protein
VALERMGLLQMQRVYALLVPRKVSLPSKTSRHMRRGLPVFLLWPAVLCAQHASADSAVEQYMAQNHVPGRATKCPAAVGCHRPTI